MPPCVAIADTMQGRWSVMDKFRVEWGCACSIGLFYALCFCALFCYHFSWEVCSAAAAAYAMRVPAPIRPKIAPGVYPIIVFARTCECVPFAFQSVLLLSTPFCKGYACGKAHGECLCESVAFERLCCCFASFPCMPPSLLSCPSLSKHRAKMAKLASRMSMLLA